MLLCLGNEEDEENKFFFFTGKKSCSTYGRIVDNCFLLQFVLIEYLIYHPSVFVYLFIIN